MGKRGWTRGNEKDGECVERAEGRGKMNDRKTREYWSRELYSLSAESLSFSLSLSPLFFVYGISSPLAYRGLLSFVLASSVLSRVLSPEASHPCTGGWVPRRLGSGSCVHPSSSLFLSPASPSLSRSVRPSFLPSSGEGEVVPVWIEAEEPEEDPSLAISRLPTGDQFYDHRGLRHLRRLVTEYAIFRLKCPYMRERVASANIRNPERNYYKPGENRSYSFKL